MPLTIACHIDVELGSKRERAQRAFLQNISKGCNSKNARISHQSARVRAYNELHGLGSPHSHKAADALVTPDGKRPHGVPGLPKDGLLSSQLLKHLHEVARYISPWVPYAVERRAPLGNPGKPSPLGLQPG